MNRWRLAGWLFFALAIGAAGYSTADTVGNLNAARAAQIEAIDYD